MHVCSQCFTSQAWLPAVVPAQTLLTTVHLLTLDWLLCLVPSMQHIAAAYVAGFKPADGCSWHAQGSSTVV